VFADELERAPANSQRGIHEREGDARMRTGWPAMACCTGWPFMSRSQM
jgi:hypothetical protein